VRHTYRCPANGWTMLTAELASRYLLDYHGLRVKPATIRQWACRGHIPATKTGGQFRYNLRDVEKHAIARGLIAE